jgi:hypothetical protein
MRNGEVYKTRDAERGNTAVYVERSLRGVFYEVGGSDPEMITLVAAFLNHISVPPGDRRKVKDQIPKYKPGPEFDTLVAQTVFGWDVTEGPVQDWSPRGLYSRNPQVEGDPWNYLPDFSDIREAWTVVEHMKRRAEACKGGIIGSAEWRRYVFLMTRIMLYHMDAEDAAFMICSCAVESIKFVRAEAEKEIARILAP